MKAGFVAIVGRSNVGKSTLLNALVGTKLAITTPKPQTTRMPIRGIVTDSRGQIVFVDTPGIFIEKRDHLTSRLNEMVQESLKDIDLIVYVVDPTRAIGNEEHRILHIIEPSTKPKIMVINKIDDGDKAFIHEYEDMAKKFTATVEVSALRHKNLKELINVIFENLSEGTPFYAEGQLTDLDQKTWIEELIREKVFLAMHEEIPYTVAVRVEEMEDRTRKLDDSARKSKRALDKKNDIFYIKASLLTTAPRYKKILIGKGGRQIKEIGQATRRELEGVLSKPVFLDLEVVVEPHWQGMV